MKNRVLAIILALVMGLSLTACVSSFSPSPSPLAPASPVTLPAPAPATPSDFDYVSGKGSVLVGYTVYAPMNYTDEQGVFTGFDTELTILVFEKLGLEPEFVEIDWSTKEIELAAKSIDCIWNGMTITEERRQNVDFTVPYLMNAQVVVMKTESGYTDTATLIGKTVCAEAGSAGETTVREDENLSKSVFIAKEKQTDCLMEVAAGTADAAVLDLTLAKAMIGPGTNYALLGIKDALAEEYYGVAFRLGSDITDKVNAAFAELIADGTMGELALKYDLALAE